MYMIAMTHALKKGYEATILKKLFYIDLLVLNVYNNQISFTNVSV